MSYDDSIIHDAVTAQLVPDDARLQTLPKHFGAACMVIENLVYENARLLVPTYRGAYWHFFELSNGGFYMAPEIKSARLFVAGNGFDDVMSFDTLGIVVCFFAFSHGSFSLLGEAADTCTRHYHWLREYSLSHRAHASISAAID